MRESVLSVDSRDESILLSICNSRDRSKAAKAVPGIGKLYIKVTRDVSSTSQFYLLILLFLPLLQDSPFVVWVMMRSN